MATPVQSSKKTAIDVTTPVLITGDVPHFEQCNEGYSYIPDGVFAMGDPNETRDVYVSAFCMEEKKVTRSELDQYMEDKNIERYEVTVKTEARVATPHDKKYHWLPEWFKSHSSTIIDMAASLEEAQKWMETYTAGEKFKTESGHKEVILGVEIKDLYPPPSIAKGPQNPALNVPWEWAQGYCQAHDGGLPTEAQWEKAARGPEHFNYATANGKLEEVMAHLSTTSRPLKEYADVGLYPANGYGLFDMLGNGAEWVHDWYAPYSSDPRFTNDPTGPATGVSRVIRGASSFFWTTSGYNNPYPLNNSYYTDKLTTWNREEAAGYPDAGFRCVQPPLKNPTDY